MDEYVKFLIIFLVYFALVFPISTFIHELGHALPALILSKEKVEIRLGTRFKGSGVRFGRLTIKVQPFSGFTGVVNFNISKESNAKARNFWILILGPMFSFFLVVGCYFVITYNELPDVIDFLIRALMFASLAQFTLTIIPMKYPIFFGAYKGTPSDGYRVLMLFKKDVT
ncbi:hypothetical protein NC661_04490 [Aquibacillus koreensis]|uniref:Peptidase M50 domain-containing protein n=1 Tax=Aquibacillus koreensis TaxID=279446 RepID=A0A9X3WGT4_9BACI|nr:site-2 protease family protein [Aquibacillus koreensis]MCT2534767.1 hypothetical protein [Aquibacillus koreensis]MDC3419622.1 hypothetical protein [Aquibacillus koreensis]